MKQKYKNIKPSEHVSKYDEAVGLKLGELAKTEPQSLIKNFNSYKDRLSNSAYWYILATMWNSYHQIGSDADWVELFSCKRINRKKGMMKSDELRKWNGLPNQVLLVNKLEDRPFVYRKYEGEPCADGETVIKIYSKLIDAYFIRRDEYIVLKEPTHPTQMDVPKFRNPDEPVLESDQFGGAPWNQSIAPTAIIQQD